jgi:hypothetical protein
MPMSAGRSALRPQPGEIPIFACVSANLARSAAAVDGGDGRRGHAAQHGGGIDGRWHVIRVAQQLLGVDPAGERGILTGDDHDPHRRILVRLAQFVDERDTGGTGEGVARLHGRQGYRQHRVILLGAVVRVGRHRHSLP